MKNNNKIPGIAPAMFMTPEISQVLYQFEKHSI